MEAKNMLTGLIERVSGSREDRPTAGTKYRLMGLVADIVAVSVPEKPGLRKLLKVLTERGMKLAVASSSPEATIEGNLRTAGLRTIQQALDRGDRVVILSASIDRWVEACLRPFLVSSSQFQVLGTEIEVVDGRLTGRFATPNCYGPEKVRRLKEFLKKVSPRGDVEGATKVSPRGDVEGALEGTPFIIAYGDSRGDKELLAYADESHYKPFR
jgi:phosphoserine phosphatase